MGLSTRRHLYPYHGRESATCQANPQAIDILRAAGIDYNLYIKLKIGGMVIGVQHYHFEDRDSVTEKNISLAKSITGLIALAVANILANEEIQYKEKQKELEILVNNSVLSNDRFSDVIREITASIENAVGCDLTYIRIFNDEIDLKSFHFFCERNGDDYLVKPVDEKVQETGNTPNQGLKNAADFLFTVKKPIILSGAKLISLVPKYKYLQIFTNKLSVQSFMFLPLHLKYNSTAYLIIASKKENAYTEKELELMEGIITQVSLTLDNRLAFHQINKLKERLETENQYLQQEVEQQYNFDEMIGQNETFNEVCKNIGLVANTDSTVLILGETGTGKELVARAIHNNSPRKIKPLIKLNCAALPASLIESELFGHERGAFTGALERRIGKFELANGSTLFLDEIGEMPLELQAKLLRALQEKEIERLGSNKTIQIDVRIIAATNRELERDVLNGKFRQDLYYRLHIFPITLPPLRERKEDIPLLAAHFLERYTKKTGKKILGFSNSAMREMMDYNWPGNIRELEHAIERCVILNNTKLINDLGLPEMYRKGKASITNGFTVKTWEKQERDYILEILKITNGNVKGKGGAAEILQLPPTTLQSKMKKLGIMRKHFVVSEMENES